MADESKKGVAFEVILKPASSDAPPQVSQGSPVKERPRSQIDIDKELKEAEENRLAQLQAMQDRLKEHERHAQEVRQKKLAKEAAAAEEGKGDA